MKKTLKIIALLTACLMLMAGCSKTEAPGTAQGPAGQSAYEIYQLASKKSLELSAYQMLMDVEMLITDGTESVPMSFTVDVKAVTEQEQLTALEMDYLFTGEALAEMLGGSGADGDQLAMRMVIVDDVLYMEMMGVLIKGSATGAEDSGMFDSAQMVDLGLSAEEFKTATVTEKDGSSLITMTIPGSYMNTLLASMGDMMSSLTEQQTDISYNDIDMSLSIDKDGVLSHMTAKTSYEVTVEGQTAAAEMSFSITVNPLAQGYQITAPANADEYMDMGDQLVGSLAS